MLFTPQRRAQLSRLSGICVAMALSSGAYAGPPIACDDPNNCQLPDIKNFPGGVILTSASTQDNFVPSTTGDITAVCWWGAYIEGTADCGPGPGDNFTITYYTNNPGCPTGAPNVVIASFKVVAAKALTGMEFLLGGFPDPVAEYGFSASHPAVPVTAGECYWIDITNDTGAGDCNFFWEVSPLGPGDGCVSGGDVQEWEMAWCIDLGLDPDTLACTSIEPLCEGAKGACNKANGSPGCEDPCCCTLVCALDPGCCEFEWDEFCAGAAQKIGCLPEPIITSADGLWTAELDDFGQILQFFPATQPTTDNVFESIVYEANSEVNDMLSRRVNGVNYTVVQGPTISPDGTSALTVLEANDVDLAMEIEILMLDGLSGGAHVKIRCENTGNAAISCKIFYYCDYDISGDFGDDEAFTIPDPPDPIFAIEQIDNVGDDGPKPLWFGGCPDYEGWEVAVYPDLLNALNGGVKALTNADATIPGSDDHTAALSSPMTQLQPGETVEFQAGVGGVNFVGCEAPPEPCPWDLDRSGSVGAADLLDLLFNWGPCPGCEADFDGDDIVGASDLLAMLFNWGPCP